MAGDRFGPHLASRTLRQSLCARDAQGKCARFGVSEAKFQAPDSGLFKMLKPLLAGQLARSVFIVTPARVPLALLARRHRQCNLYLGNLSNVLRNRLNG